MDVFSSEVLFVIKWYISTVQCVWAAGALGHCCQVQRPFFFHQHVLKLIYYCTQVQHRSWLYSSSSLNIDTRLYSCILRHANTKVIRFLGSINQKAHGTKPYTELELRANFACSTEKRRGVPYHKYEFDAHRRIFHWPTWPLFRSFMSHITARH